MTILDLIAEIDTPSRLQTPKGQAALVRLERAASATLIGVLLAREAYRLAMDPFGRRQRASNPALRALRTLGPSAVDQLITGLQVGDPTDETAIAYAIGELGAVRAEDELNNLGDKVVMQLMRLKKKQDLIEKALEKLRMKEEIVSVGLRDLENAREDNEEDEGDRDEQGSEDYGIG